MLPWPQPAGGGKGLVLAEAVAGAAGPAAAPASGRAVASREQGAGDAFAVGAGRACSHRRAHGG